MIDVVPGVISPLDLLAFGESTFEALGSILDDQLALDISRFLESAFQDSKLWSSKDSYHVLLAEKVKLLQQVMSTKLRRYELLNKYDQEMLTEMLSVTITNYQYLSPEKRSDYYKKLSNFLKSNDEVGFLFEITARTKSNYSRFLTEASLAETRLYTMVIQLSKDGCTTHKPLQGTLTKRIENNKSKFYDRREATRRTILYRVNNQINNLKTLKRAIEFSNSGRPKCRRV